MIMMKHIDTNGMVDSPFAFQRMPATVPIISAVQMALMDASSDRVEHHECDGGRGHKHSYPKKSAWIEDRFLHTTMLTNHTADRNGI